MSRRQPRSISASAKYLGTPSVLLSQPSVAFVTQVGAKTRCLANGPIHRSLGHRPRNRDAENVVWLKAMFTRLTPQVGEYSLRPNAAFSNNIPGAMPQATVTKAFAQSDERPCLSPQMLKTLPLQGRAGEFQSSAPSAHAVPPIVSGRNLRHIKYLTSRRVFLDTSHIK